MTDHHAVGRGGDLELEIEAGLDTVELRYAGPDPRASIFVDVTSDEAVAEAAAAVGGLDVLFNCAGYVASGNVLSHQLDFSAAPSAGRLMPGTQWHFQAWYRDPAAGGAGYNLTDGLSVTFCN